MEIIQSSWWKTASKTLLILLDIDFSYLMHSNLVNPVTAGGKNSSCPEKNQTGKCIARERERSPAAAQHGTRNRHPGKQKTWTETAWKLLEQAKGAQEVKAGDYITLRLLSLVRCERVDTSSPRQKAKPALNFVRRMKKSSWVTAWWSTGCVFHKVKAVYLF